jgi:deazaflavin-dependent oxidoreductase (nitroreductase family)
VHALTLGSDGLRVVRGRNARSVKPVTQRPLWFDRHMRVKRQLIRAMSRTHLAVQRLSRGRLLGTVAGMPVLLLTTTGRRSGKPRTTPLTFLRDGTELVVIASNGGSDRTPDWCLNLQHDPLAIVEIGTDKLNVTARTASAADRERLWPRITSTYAGYAKYQARTTREIPVVLLQPDG